jgi:hypothetical protein
VIAFLPPHPTEPAGPGPAVPEAPRRLSSLPQAVSVPALIANATANAVSALPIPTSLTHLAF